MPKGKSKTSDSKRSAQKIRTARNQIKRYEKLLEKYPDHKDTNLWNGQVDFFKGSI